MAFPELIDKEILGFFDPNYDVVNISLDIRQIISDDLNWDITNYKGTPKNIYLEELDNAGARTAGISEKDHINSLDSFEKKVYDKYKPEGDGGYFIGSSEQETINLENSSIGRQHVHPNPTNFINKFIVPKVEELVDFITLDQLEEQVNKYLLSLKSIDYYYWTTYENPKKVVNRQKRVYDTLSGDDYRFISPLNTKVSEQIKRNFSSPAVSWIQNIGQNRRGADILEGKYTTGFAKRSSTKIFKEQRSNGIILEPNNPQDFDASNPYKPAGKISLSQKYDADLSRNNSKWYYYDNDSIQFLDENNNGFPDTQKVINKIASIESRLEALDFEDTYRAREIAKILMVRWALKTLADQIRLLRQQVEIADDKEAVAALADQFLEAAKRERETNPEFDPYNSQITENLSKAVQRKIEIQPQCFLISNIIEAAELNRLRLNQPFIEYQYTRLVSSPKNTAATINKLTRKKSQKNMLSMRTDHVAKLHPYLRIYKTIFNQEGKVEREAEFKFPNFTNVQSTNRKMEVVGYVSNKYTQDYGITSFNWDFVGSDPFSYANDIDATLTLHFNDFEQLVLPRQTTDYASGEIVKYRLLDLIALSEKELQELNRLSGSTISKSEYKYDIRVDVGWNGPAPEKVNGFDAEDSIRTLFLAMTDYDIGFNQEGFFELTINYKARLEQALYDRRTNVLELPSSEKNEVERLQKDLSDLKANSSAGGSSNIDLIRGIENDIARLQFDIKGETFSNIVKFLIDNGSIFSESLTPQQLYGPDTVDLTQASGGLADESAFKNLKKITNLDVSRPGFSILSVSGVGAIYEAYNFLSYDEEVAKQQRLDNISEEQRSFVPKKENGKYIMNFFFLGDLIEALCKAIFERDVSRTPEEQAFIKDVRVITTDFLIYDPNNLKSKAIHKINISDIPISVELFMSFYFEKVIKYNVSSYSLLKFIRDIISYCILNIFEECFGEDNLRSSINTAFADFEKVQSFTNFSFQDPFRVYAAESNPVQDQIQTSLSVVPQFYNHNATLYKSYLNLDKTDQIPNIASKNMRADCIHALIIYTDAFDPEELKIEPGQYHTKRKDDNDAGLYHLDIGSARGILKKINFSKTDQRYLREQRYTQDVAKGFAILSNVFDVDIDLVGNTLFFPGQRVYINLGERFSALGKPYAKGFSFAKVMGMGGYHIVTSVENEISPDGYNTKIKARWETSGDGKNKDMNSGVGIGDASTSVSPSSPIILGQPTPTVD